MPIDLPVPLREGHWSEIGKPGEVVLCIAHPAKPPRRRHTHYPQWDFASSHLTYIESTQDTGSTIEPALFDDSSDPPSKIASSNDEDWILTEETPPPLGDLKIPTLKLATLSTKGEDEKGKQKEEKPRGRTFKSLGILQTPPPRADNDNTLPTLATIPEESDDLEQPDELDETLEPDPSWILERPKQDGSDRPHPSIQFTPQNSEPPTSASHSESHKHTTEERVTPRRYSDIPTASDPAVGISGASSVTSPTNQQVTSGQLSRRSTPSNGSGIRQHRTITTNGQTRHRMYPKQTPQNAAVEVQHHLTSLLQSVNDISTFRFGNRATNRPFLQRRESIPPTLFSTLFPTFDTYLQLEEALNPKGRRARNKWLNYLPRLRQARQHLNQVLQATEALVINHGYPHGLREFLYCQHLDIYGGDSPVNSLFHTFEAEYLYNALHFFHQFHYNQFQYSFQELLHCRFGEPIDMWNVVQLVVDRLEPPLYKFQLDVEYPPPTPPANA
ncbi:hypothetical protein CPB83DRAFT_896725 [Crepidotus variabilis]|uniref:Uncharacterized protein n=1 Tax=Crepidotus variabilis TaxID=179855 RepID=A0A9P6EBF1_9AGAR|nr:hypothetical protein CPB83DRAFT_896725 [Crepidotus variabilis]